jgi:hypothetical protein
MVLEWKSRKMDVLNQIMTWIVAPVAAFVFIMHRKLAENSTCIAVLNSEVANLRELHGREVKDMKVSMERIFEKLDSIEQTLRK